MPVNEVPSVLITGASGVLGHGLLAAREDRAVVGLVHRTEPDVPVPVIRGDVTRGRLGLTKSDYHLLCDHLSAIVHCAALTDFTESVDDITQVNVDGTGRVLQLAKDAGIPLVLVSSAFSTMTDIGDGQAHYTYVESKKCAEDLVGGSDATSVIVRPSLTLGHSKTGYIQHYQVFHRMMAAILRDQMPMLPADPDGVIDYVSSDWVAESIWALLGEPHPAVYETVWLTAGPEVMSVSHVLDVWFKFARRVGRMPERPRIINPEMIDRLIRPLLLEELPPTLARRFDTAVRIASLMTRQHQFPSSELPFLPTRPDAVSVLLSNAAYWAVRSSFAPADLAWEQARQCRLLDFAPVGAGS
jgi:thioester reductase-like protein